MYDTVVVPTDGSDEAVRAADHAVWLARRFDATVHVLHVVDSERVEEVTEHGTVREQLSERLAAAGERAVSRVEEAVADAPTVETHTLHGSPAATIQRFTEEIDADLVSMGTSGRSGLDRLLLGSTAETVLRQVDCPVLTTRATPESELTESGYDEILLPTDGSDRADAAVDHTLAVAEQADARVHVVSVVDIAAVTTLSGYVVEEFVDRQRESADETTTRLADRARERGLDAVTAVRKGYPTGTLLEYAEERGVDLITMATAGRSGLDRLLLGSTTERVVRESPVPVLAVRT
jgi:nucleotide-binding universal stress UspA family protein